MKKRNHSKQEKSSTEEDENARGNTGGHAKNVNNPRNGNVRNLLQDKEQRI